MLGTLLVAVSALAAPGDLLATIPIPTPSYVGVAADCAGGVYYTEGTQLHRMDTAGRLLATVPVVDAATSSPLSLGGLAWDASRGLLWAEEDGDFRNHRVFRVDPLTGRAVFVFDNFAGPPLTCANSQKCAIAWDPLDDTVRVRVCSCDNVAHWSGAGAYLGLIRTYASSGYADGFGIAAGAGGVLFLGVNRPAVSIVAVRKSNGAWLSDLVLLPRFATGLACDAVSFAPATVLWAKANDEMFIVEIDPGACGSRDPLPGDLGNTLRGVRAGGEVVLSWGSDPLAQSYALHRSTAKGSWPAPAALLGLPAPAARLPDVPAPPSLYLYRASGASCAGLGP